MPKSTPPHAEYVRTLRPLLPKEAFQPRPDRLLHIFGYVALVGACVFAVGHVAPLWLCPLLGIVIGLADASLGLLAHDLSHNTVLRNRKTQYLLELFLWCSALIPPTVWKHWHNLSHHRAPNTMVDPDRKLFRSEDTPLARFLDRLFTPSRQSRGFNLTGLSFSYYFVRNTLAALFYSAERKPSFVPALPKYSKASRIRICFEVAIIIAIQLGTLALVGWDPWRYACVSVVPWIVLSQVLFAYIQTQHFTSPYADVSDPLRDTVSVQVPPLFDFMHQNFSHHAEHHIFPGMSGYYYPLVRKLLEQHFPDRYRSLPWRTAVKEAYSSARFIDEIDSNPSSIPSASEATGGKAVGELSP